MPNYDTPGLFYDTPGVFYDDTTPPPIVNTKKRMSTLKLNLSKLTDPQLIQLAIDSNTSMTGNANFTTPVPTIAALATLITAGQTKLSATTANVQTGKLLTSDKNVTMDSIRASLTQRAAYVAATVGTDPVKLQSSGFSLKAHSSPVGVPAQVLHFAATAGDADGEIDLQWDPVAGANSYEIMVSPDPITLTSWVNHSSVTASKAVLLGLVSGTRMWFKARAIGAAGAGAYSDPATKIVP